MNVQKKIEDKLKEIASSPLLNSYTQSILKCAASQISYLEKKVSKLENDKLTLFQAMIGLPIYWANPNWKMEEHVITGVRFEESYWSDFFDSDKEVYKGTPQIVIEVDGDEECRGGDYLAVNIGKNLFFNKEEALKHSKYANLLQK